MSEKRLYDTYRFLAVWIAVFLIFSSLGCGEKKDDPEILVEIGSIRITVDDFEDRISNLPTRYRRMVNNRRDEYLQEYINDMLLYRAAKGAGVHNKEDVRKLIAQARKKIIISRFLKDEVEDRIGVSEEEVIDYYENNASEFLSPATMRLSHILVQSREEAESLLKQLDDGAVFESLARAKSVDPSAQRGGDVGFFPKGQLMPEFEKAINTLEVGDISGVVETNLGYHIIKLTAREEPKPVPVEQVEEHIRKKLYRQEKQYLFNKLLNDLRENVTIKINEEALAAKNGIGHIKTEEEAR